MEHFANSPGVAARLRLRQSVRTVIKIYNCYKVTALLVFHDNFMRSILLFFAIRTRSRLIVQSNPVGVHQT